MLCPLRSAPLCPALDALPAPLCSSLPRSAVPIFSATGGGTSSTRELTFLPFFCAIVNVRWKKRGFGWRRSCRCRAGLGCVRIFVTDPERVAARSSYTAVGSHLWCEATAGGHPHWVRDENPHTSQARPAAGPWVNIRPPTLAKQDNHTHPSCRSRLMSRLVRDAASCGTRCGHEPRV
eukprot:359498-Chlamydomonas_euryale.AAC.2